MKNVILSALLLALGSLFLFSCTEAGLQEEIEDPPRGIDNLLDIHGEYCTSPAEELEFPVKILLVMDQSNSLQCTDTDYQRLVAVNEMISGISNDPSVSLGYLGFNSATYFEPFSPPASMGPVIDGYSRQQGPATDYQGILAATIQNLEIEMITSPLSLLARTKYVIVFVSDGIPEPRCDAGCEDDEESCSDGEDNDGDTFTDGADPDCDNVIPDSLYPICNTDEDLDEVAPGEYVDMRSICPEYNQESQILRKVEDLVALGEAYGVGGITLHTVFLFADQATVEARCPGAETNFGYVRDEAMPLLQAMAAAGDGIFREYNTAIGSEANFLDFDYQPLESAFDLTETIGSNQNATADIGQRAPDTDGDGLDDDLEFEYSLDRFSSDTDNDGYGDLFEVRFNDRGFDAADGNKPYRCCADFGLKGTCCENPNRCICVSPPPETAPLLGAERDIDGDSLTTPEEYYLHTNHRSPDSDGDRIDDGVEFRFGLDPTLDDAQEDHDFDGIRSIDEIRMGTDPQVPNSEIESLFGTTYSIEDVGDNDENQSCYNFEINNLELVTTLETIGFDGEEDPVSQGLNRIYIRMTEEPVELAGHQGNQMIACVEATYLGSQFKDPMTGLIDLRDIYEACYQSCLGCNEWETIEECRYNADPVQLEDCDPPCKLFYLAEDFVPEIHCVSSMCTNPDVWIWRDNVTVDGINHGTNFMCDDNCLSDGYQNYNCTYDCDINPYRTERCATIRFQ